MKKLPMLIFCLCVIFSSVCFADNPVRKCVEKKVTTRKKKAPAIFRPFVYLFNKITGKHEPMVRPMVNLECLELSKTDVYASSSNNFQTIEVTTTPDPARADPTDVLTFNYTVSGGKIVGQGAKVVWDLSGVKPGTYTITAAAEDGCGVCGNTITIEVKVIE
jgi:hypothetical protein